MLCHADDLVVHARQVGIGCEDRVDSGPIAASCVCRTSPLGPRIGTPQWAIRGWRRRGQCNELLIEVSATDSVVAHDDEIGIFAHRQVHLHPFRIEHVPALADRRHRHRRQHGEHGAQPIRRQPLVSRRRPRAARAVCRRTPAAVPSLVDAVRFRDLLRDDVRGDFHLLAVNRPSARSTPMLSSSVFSVSASRQSLGGDLVVHSAFSRSTASASLAGRYRAA